MPSFKDIANKKLSEIEKPKNPPVGYYAFSVSKVPTPRNLNSDKGTFEAIDFDCVAVQGMEGVDPQELAEFGIQNVRARVSFIFNNDDATRFERTEYDLRVFLTHLGIPEEIAIAEAVGASAGRNFVGQLGLREDPKSPGNYFTEIKNTAAIS